MSTEVTQPDDYLTLKIGKEDERELFMSAALVRTLVSIIGTGEDFINMLTDPNVQMQLMAFVLCPRDDRGRPVEDFTLDSIPLSPSEGTKLLKWIEDHVLYFFISSAETTQASMRGPAIQKLTDLLNGLKGSVPETGSAGPTTVEQATT